MKKITGVLIFVFTCIINGLAQVPVTTHDKQANPELSVMSSYDSLKLSNLPVLKFPEETTKRLLPYAHDNSLQPWMRPLIAQAGLECGQASSIGVVFTYEMNYLRNVPGNLPENQYATHFAYNFINGGGDAGVCFYETYEILKYAGNPTVADYGGMSAGGPSRWMSGYNQYYNAMQNRVSEVYSIKMNTTEGLQTLKNWLFDHGNGSSGGGLGCFYSQYTNPTDILPVGTPEAGKHVIYSWGGSPNHAMSIVGYNDSIRWDYNNDGQYTNDIDINSDGLVDMRDWEIGGFKMANTYGSIGYWGDQGFAYMMYKSVADQTGQGGIWNNTVVVIDVRDSYQPQLTAKVNLSYTCRDLLRVMVGVSSDPDATEPDHILHYPIYDFQGGCNPMQGGDLGIQSIEFGLDLNLLLQYVNPGEEAKYFILVQENDPFGAQEGTLESFSLVDYTNGGTVINCASNEIPLVNNNITMANINATVDFTPVTITTEELAPIELYSNYSFQLEASAGTLPYKWRIVEDYDQLDSVSVMPIIDSQRLQVSSNNNGNAKVELPFSFPFYGQNFNEVYATVDGYLMFQNSLLPWPYYIEGRTYFIETAMIAPVMSNPLVISESTDGIWYEEGEDFVTFRWKLSVSGAGGTTFNATARLYMDGRIEINYGDFVIPSYVERYAGISAGDGENFEIMSYDPDYSPVVNQLLRFSPTRCHPGISLSKDGILSGQIDDVIDNSPLTVCVTDKNNLKDYKTFNLNTEGLIMDYGIVAGDDNIIGFGEEVSMTLNITNTCGFPITTTTLNLSTFDAYFNLIDNQAIIPGLQPGETVTINEAFSFNTNNNVPDNHSSMFQLTANSSEGSWTRSLELHAFRAVTAISSVSVIDGNNGVLEPGETAQIVFNIINTGGADLINATELITCTDSYITLNSNSGYIDTLNPAQVSPLVFNVQLSAEAPISYVIEFNLIINGDNEFHYSTNIPVYVGTIIEDFETGDLLSYKWETSGNNIWYAEQDNAFQGDWCGHSGLIYDDQSSVLSLKWDVAYPDSISFWYKVSSEPSYDFLRFFTKSGEVEKWSGSIDWTKAVYMIPEGENEFIWKYTKDYSVSNGEDCARIDYIVLPVCGIPTSAKTEDIIEATLSIYPNPSLNKINIKYSIEKPSPVQLKIIDIHGREIYMYEDRGLVEAGEYQIGTDLLEIKPGIYTVILNTNSGLLAKKIIKTN